MKTSITRMRDHETGGLQISINLDPRDLEGLGLYRDAFPQFELTMIPDQRMPRVDANSTLPPRNSPITCLLRSEFANLLAQVIVAELVASGALPRPDQLRPLTPTRKPITTGD